MGNPRFERLRALVYAQPSAEAWDELCELLDGWSQADGLEEALVYAEPLLQRWPTALRQPPPYWDHDDVRRRLTVQLQPLEAAALSLEREIVWLEPPERFDYVRQRFVLAHLGTGAPRWERSGRVVGYARLDWSGQRRPSGSGRVLQRVFVAAPYDRDSDPHGVYAGRVPDEGVDPRTVLAGVLGWVTPQARRGFERPEVPGAAALDVLQQRWEGCTRCRLGHKRQQLVFGVGDPQARLVVLTDAPAEHDDHLGVPFVGRRERMLEMALGQIGLRRPDVYLMTLVKCRPPSDRAPRVDEVRACQRLFEAQLDIVQPRVVLAMGQASVMALGGGLVQEQRGQWRAVEQAWRVMPTHSLEEALEDSRLRALVWRDVQEVGRVLRLFEEQEKAGQ